MANVSNGQKKKTSGKKPAKKEQKAKAGSSASKKKKASAKKKTPVNGRKVTASKGRTRANSKAKAPSGYAAPVYFEPIYNPTLDERPLPPVLSVVDQMPQFDGDVNEYLRQRIEYPDTTRLGVKEGTVMVKFIVTVLGDLRNATIVRSIDPLLDQEALRVVREMPRWNPGRHKGLYANVYYTLPVKFHLY
jgi:TonB family protein